MEQQTICEHYGLLLNIETINTKRICNIGL